LTCCRSIDVREWARQGCLHPNQRFSWSWSHGGEPFGSITVRTGPDAVPGAVVLSFRSRGSSGNRWRSVEQRVPVTWTECHLGGRRPWFRCTACGRRVAKLCRRSLQRMRRTCKPRQISRRPAASDRRLVSRVAHHRSAARPCTVSDARNARCAPTPTPRKIGGSLLAGKVVTFQSLLDRVTARATAGRRHGRLYGSTRLDWASPCGPDYRDPAVGPACGLRRCYLDVLGLFPKNSPKRGEDATVSV
jgi:hypothetical protein